jgi:hypothetical protein
MSAILSFYAGRGTDHAGRTLDDILAWDDWHLEEVHDYIQWLFPLEEPSRANPHAPLLTSEDIAAFRESPELLEALRRSFTRILAFYGLEAIESAGDTLIRRSPDWPIRSRNWVKPSNHNHLRLTRIMKSLSLLGLGEHAQALSRVLLALAAEPKSRAFTRTTIRIWEDASQEISTSREGRPIDS